VGYGAPNDYNGVTKLAHCGDAACSTGNSIVVLDPTSSPAFDRFRPTMFLALPSDAKPLVAYVAPGVRGTKMAKCGDASCTSGNSAFLLGGAGHPAMISDPAIGATGLPFLAFGQGRVWTFACTNPDCR
jgi:hypothetical protein